MHHPVAEGFKAVSSARSIDCGKTERGAEKKLAERGSKRQRATSRALAQRDLRLIEKLAAGATIEEIAASEGISVKWARERKAAVLASRVIDTPHEFIKLQIAA
jgi:hypothetical protein